MGCPEYVHPAKYNIIIIGSLRNFPSIIIIIVFIAVTNK